MTSRSFKSLFCNQNVRKTEKWNMNGQLKMKKKEKKYKYKKIINLLVT